MKKDSVALLPEPDSLSCHAPPPEAGLGGPELCLPRLTVRHAQIEASLRWRPTDLHLLLSYVAVSNISFYPTMTRASFFSFQGPKFLTIKEFWRKCYMTIFSLTVSSQARTSSGSTTFGTNPKYTWTRWVVSWKVWGEGNVYLSTNIPG